MFHCFSRRFGGSQPVHLKLRPQGENFFAQLQSNSRLRQGAILPLDCNQGFGGVGDNHVAGVPHVGRDCQRHISVGSIRSWSGQNTEHFTAGFSAATRSRRHNAAKTTADQHRSSFGDQPADVFGQA